MDFEEFDRRLAEFEKHLEPFFKMHLDELLPHCSLEDTAKLKLTMAFCLNALFYVFMKVNGLSPAEHEVKNELERIKTYMTKMKAMTDVERSRISLNKEAAARFLEHALRSYKNRNEDTIDATTNNDLEERKEEEEKEEKEEPVGKEIVHSKPQSFKRKASDSSLSKSKKPKNKNQ